jgi:hypothetical protein
MCCRTASVGLIDSSTSSNICFIRSLI